MIKLTNEEITATMVQYKNGQAVANQAMESLKAKKLPVKNQYWIRRVLDKISRDFKVLEETRQEIVKQHAKKDDEGKVTPDEKGNITIENIIEFQKDIAELMATEVDLGIEKVKIDFDKWEELIINNKGEKVAKYDALDGKEMDLLLPILKVE